MTTKDTSFQQPAALRYSLAAKKEAVSLYHKLLPLAPTVLFQVGTAQYPNWDASIMLCKSVNNPDSGPYVYEARLEWQTMSDEQLLPQLQITDGFKHERGRERIALVTVLWSPEQMLREAAHYSYCSHRANEKRMLEDALFPLHANLHGIRWVRKLVEPYGYFVGHVQLKRLHYP